MVTTKRFLGGLVIVISSGDGSHVAHIAGVSKISAKGDTPELALANLMTMPSAFDALAVDFRQLSHTEREARRLYQAVVNNSYVIVHGELYTELKSALIRLFNEANMTFDLQDFGDGTFLLRDAERTNLRTLKTEDVSWNAVKGLNELNYWLVGHSETAQYYLAQEAS